MGEKRAKKGEKVVYNARFSVFVAICVDLGGPGFGGKRGGPEIGRF